MKVVAKKKPSAANKQGPQFLCKLSNGESFQCESLFEANKRVADMNAESPTTRTSAVVIKEFYEIRPITNLVEQQKAAERMHAIAKLRNRRDVLLSELGMVRRGLRKYGLKR